MARTNRDRMPDFAYRMMSAIMAIEDAVFPRVDRRVAGFGIQKGMTIVDYGCGPGRYTLRFARLVGETGRVYAVDVQELAIEGMWKRIAEACLTNIIPSLARGYITDIPAHIADRVFALDMFFGVKDPYSLLGEIHRITRPDGVLILDDGHQTRRTTLVDLGRHEGWRIVAQNRDHITCSPV